MSEESSLIKLDGLTAPATKLVEKICDGIEGLYRPTHIRRVAKAEADASLIKAKGEIAIDDLKHRAQDRAAFEEIQKQLIMESIISKALPDVAETAKPEDVENDWILNFFDKCRIISDEEMQSLWAKVLAGEANVPGTYSKRTVNFLNSLDKADAKLFTSLCSFCWYVGLIQPLIYEYGRTIYSNQGIHFNSLSHLDDIGLISHQPLEIMRSGFRGHVEYFLYYGTPLGIQFSSPENNSLNIGKVVLTQVGHQLAPICGSKPIPEFYDYIVQRWADEDLKPFSPYTKNRDIYPHLGKDDPNIPLNLLR